MEGTGGLAAALFAKKEKKEEEEEKEGEVKEEVGVDEELIGWLRSHFRSKKKELPHSFLRLLSPASGKGKRPFGCRPSPSLSSLTTPGP